MDKLMNPENVQNPGLAEKQLFVQGQLNKLLHDKEGFVRWAERAETHHTAMQPKKARPSHKEDEAYLHVKLDMVTFLALLRANDLYGKTGFTGFTDQAVRQAWKVNFVFSVCLITRFLYQVSPFLYKVLTFLDAGCKRRRRV